MSRERLESGVRALRGGNRREARRILGQLVHEEPDNANAWWYLALALDDAEQKQRCLKQVLRLRPEHDEARRILNALELEVTKPTPAEGIQRPVLTADEEDTGTLRMRTQHQPAVADEPPAPTRERDLLVAGIATIIALFAIVGTVILVITGRGQTLGFNPPDSTATPISISFDIPACVTNEDGSEETTIVFINNASVPVEVLRGEQGSEEPLTTIQPGEQGRITAVSEQQVRYALRTEAAGYAGTGAIIEVPRASSCRVPIQ